MNELAPIGHNNPPSDAEILQNNLTDRSAELRKRYDDLMASVARAPDECNDDEMAGKFGDMVKLITACSKSFETMRVAEKEPYLTLERTVDGYFKRYTESLLAAKKKITAPLEKYLKRKEEENRRREREEAERKRAEAERLAQEAAQLESAKLTDIADQTLNEAARIDEEANKAAKLAGAKPAELARTRGGYGSVSTLRTTWVGVIDDRNLLDLEALRS